MVTLYRIWCKIKDGDILLGDFSDLTSAKLTIEGFSQTRYNLIKDEEGFLRAKDFLGLRKYCTIRIEEKRW